MSVDVEIPADHDVPRVTGGVDEFCAKPCIPADLVATIRRHLK